MPEVECTAKILETLCSLPKVRKIHKTPDSPKKTKQRKHIIIISSVCYRLVSSVIDMNNTLSTLHVFLHKLNHPPLCQILEEIFSFGSLL